MESSDGAPPWHGLVGRGCPGDASLTCTRALAFLCLQNAGRKPGREIWGCLGLFARKPVPWGEHGQGCGCLNDMSGKKSVNEPFIPD